MLLVRLAPNLVTSGQIRPADIPGVAAARFGLLINCRPDDEEPGQPCSSELEKAAKQAKLDYRHIPVARGQVSEAATRAFADAMAGATGEVLAFCSNGNRPTALWKAASLLK